MAHKEQKQMLIDAIKVKLDLANNQTPQDIYDDYWLGGRGSAFEECLELIEGIL